MGNILRKAMIEEIRSDAQEGPFASSTKIFKLLDMIDEIREAVKDYCEYEIIDAKRVGRGTTSKAYRRFLIALGEIEPE